jgi:vesicle coat complex subunit
MALAIERSCSMIVSLDSPGNPNEIKAALEGNDIELKIEMLKKAIAMSLSGENIPGLFICMIRYVLPSEDHTVQRLLLLYLVRPMVKALCVSRSGMLTRQAWCHHWHGISTG